MDEGYCVRVGLVVLISSRFAPLEMHYEDKRRAVLICWVAMNDEGGKGQPK